MSNVILLSEISRNRTATVVPQGQTAEIVIFHGVRIERLTDEMVAVQAPRLSRRIASLSNQATATELE